MLNKFLTCNGSPLCLRQKGVAQFKIMTTMLILENNLYIFGAFCDDHFCKAHAAAFDASLRF